MAAAASIISVAAQHLNKKLAYEGYNASEDTRQEIALFLCHHRNMVTEYANGNKHFVYICVRNRLLDIGYGNANSHIDIPRMDDRDSETTRALKLSALRNQVSINDELDGDQVETILPCRRYEQAEVWRKVRSNEVFSWIEKNAPFLDYLLEANKKETPAPSTWNTRPIIRAYAGADEVTKLLRRFGQSLTADEKLHIKEAMFQRFLHAKKAPLVQDENMESDPDFFMAM